MRILVVQLRQLGDILLTTPCVRALRQAWPEAELAFFSHAMGRLILKANPDLDELITYSPDAGWREELRLALRLRRFDLVFDFMNNPRSAFYTRMTGAPRRIAFRSARAPAYTQTVAKPRGEDYIVRHKFLLLQAAGLNPTDQRLIMPWEPAAADPYERFQASLPELSASPYKILLSPTHRRAPRRWPLASYAALADRLTRQWGATVLWLYGPGEEEVVDAAMALCQVQSYKTPATAFGEMAALIANMDLFIGNSNGPSHVAVAADIPSLQLHGHTSAVSWCPRNERHQALQASEYGRVERPRIEAISLENVWQKLTEMRPMITAVAATKARGGVVREWRSGLIGTSG